MMDRTAAAKLVNLARLEARMDAAGLDAIVARTGINFTYLAGFAYPGTLARHLDLADSPRGVYVIWPRHGDPAIVTNSIAAGLAERDSWIGRIEVYAGYTEPPIERVAKVLAEMGLADSTVGFEQYFINAADWQTLAKALPKMRMRDSTAVMDDVRAVKTPGEVALLRRGADLLDKAYLECFPAARPGMMERELHAALVRECLATGCHFVHGILNSSRNTIAYAGESDFEFAAGDAIRTDYVAYIDGYPGHQSRCAVIGTPSADQRREYQVIRDIYRACLEECRPGRTAGEVYDAVVGHFSAKGLQYHSMLAGHSVGCWWHQQEPVISRGNSRRLEAGMVIAMEPHIDHWHIQDMILLRPDGPELLSPLFPTDEIFICG
jgi:Xaa-Pro aminopeptidase